MNKYRIEKFQDRYIVQVLKTETITTGLFWWRKKIAIEKWVSCNSIGNPLVFNQLGVNWPPLGSFKTIDHAKNQIDTFLSPIEYTIYP